MKCLSGRARREQAPRRAWTLMAPWGSTHSPGQPHAQVHGPGVQIDAAVESMLLVVEAHAWSPLAWVREPDPASWLEGASFLKIPRWGRSFAALGPYTLGTGPGPPQKETMISIKPLNQTGHANEVLS